MRRQSSSDLECASLHTRSMTSAESTPISKSWPGWVECVHPEGWRYFQKDNIVTDAAPDRQQEVEQHIATIVRTLTDDSYDISVSSSATDPALKTVFVNHELRYASEKMHEVTSSADALTSDRRRIEYWKFMCHYPAHRPLPSGALIMARQLLECYIMDSLRRRSESHAPFRLEQSKELLEYLEKFNGTENGTLMLKETTMGSGVPSRSSAIVELVSWILLTSARHRQLHKYGQRSVHNLQSKSNQHISFLLISAICFGAPRSHLHRTREALSTMKLQGRADAWAEFMDVLHGELGISVLATVVLTAAVSFLAVPGIDNVTIIVTLVTIAFTLASIMTGIYLQWQTGKVRFVDIEPSLAPLLATFFSVPFALLTWGMVLFTSAVLLYSILGYEAQLDTSVGRFGRATYTSVFVFSFVFVCVIGVNVTFFRHLRHNHRQAQQQTDL
ncbi:hypothetical protein NEOLEDRAFT_658078 [Neolentinus lepideus HHB14362 ss-1]|uniref:Uncharacterized protein n=1 Tax=Neolentinus lepideus HHB14362 ss-1 TaxID=1314782 RepID=A0A165QFZ2_9AGAM|nr:hypothetical protein NEOLEDRAFT_658078 [Neolentinus lepideus HHB14362 ss-1]